MGMLTHRVYHSQPTEELTDLIAEIESSPLSAVEKKELLDSLSARLA